MTKASEKSKKECVNGIAWYADRVIVRNSSTRAVYFIEPPSKQNTTTSSVYGIMPGRTLSLADGVLIKLLLSGIFDAQTYISLPKDGFISCYTLITTTSTAADGFIESYTKEEARFVEQSVPNDFVTRKSIALLNDVLVVLNFSFGTSFYWKLGRSINVFFLQFSSMPQRDFTWTCASDC